MAINFICSQRLSKIQSSSTLEATRLATKLRKAGHNVIDLGAGEPDFITPQNICNAAKRALDEGNTKYTPVSGIQELKTAISEYVKSETGTHYDPSQIVVSSGGKQILFNAITTLINPEDEVIIPSPYWVTFPEIVVFAEGTPVFVDTVKNNFKLTADMVEHAITPLTKLVIINSPNNPSGHIIDSEELFKIAEIISNKSLWLISDECYYKFTYPPHKPFSVASLPANLRERILIAGSFSKTYAMTGWRIGYALAHQDWISEMVKLQGHSTSSPTSFVQWGAIEAIQGNQNSVSHMISEYQKRRTWLIPALNKLRGFSCYEPEGAFYAFPSIQEVLDNSSIKTDTEFANLLLNEMHVVVTPGSAFGTPGHLRISYANSLEAIQEGITRISKLVDKVWC